jgi:hypothetical protein
MASTIQRAFAFAAASALLGAAAGCPSPDPHGTGGSGGGDAGPPAWQVVLDDKTLGGAVLSVWGTGPDDVYAVGGPLGNSGFDAIAVHYDGAKWTKLSPGGADSFWWVAGSGAKDVWMVGEKGRITHYDGASFVESPRLTTATIWGVWAASASDAWAVGGTPEGGTSAPNDVVLHWDGQAWSEDALPQKLGRALNKVWGTSSSDLYAVGEAGTIWHRKGTTWSLEKNPATANLFTVYGCSATDVYVVGGQDVLHSDGSGTWTKVDVQLGNSANGVTCNPGGNVLVVGFGGLKQRLVDGEWINEFTTPPYGDLHGSWADGHGAFWAVGGDFASSPAAGKARRAIISRYGSGTIPAIGP